MDTIYYNYVYLDITKPSKIETSHICFLYEPLYVGKGKGKRCFHGSLAATSNKNIVTNYMLYCKLKSLIKKNIDPNILLFNTDTTSIWALCVEDEIIRLLGRKKIDPNGILCNRALGGEIPDTTGVPCEYKGIKMIDRLPPERYEKFMESVKKSKTKEHTAKMLKTRMQNNPYTIGENHPRAKKYVLISPSFEEFELHGNIKAFCASKDLSWQTLYNNKNAGPIIVDRTKYKNLKRLTQRFWNTVGWECKTVNLE